MSNSSWTKFVVVCLLSVSFLSFCASAPVYGQTGSTGTVSGQVTDQSDAVVAGATVTLTDININTPRTTTSNDAGRYIFADVPPGMYDLTVTKPGFRMARFSSQTVNIGSPLTLNVKLDIGAASETVEVTYTPGAELQTMNAAVGTTISGDSLQFLPNLGRDASTLAVLQPGVTPAGFTAGAYADQNTYTLDGGNNSDDMSGNYTTYTTNFTGTGGNQTGGSPSGVVPTPVESIEEFRVNTFNQTADFNDSIGGQIQMVTKRGTNRWHGAGYEHYYATNIGAANYWDKNHTPSNGRTYTPLASNHRNRFGAAVGGPITPQFWGGKTYFFFNYEGSRFPNVATYERAVPSVLLRAGVIQVLDSDGVYRSYNLNPAPVTVNGVTYQPAQCTLSANGLCDPRGIGLNPIVNQIWSKQMPLPNDPNYGSNGADGRNVQGYQATIRAPLTSDFYVGRLDHDFGSKWHFMSSYRFLHLINVTTNQVDIGGVLPGGALGQPVATAPRTQVPSYLVVGLTTNITPSVTNSFVFNYTRNFWQWGSSNAPPQLPGLGGAVEIGNGAPGSAENLNALIPYNVNTQNIRQRFWDGKDRLIRDDLTMIKGNHLFQFGGLYQRNFDFHMRTDNGQGINNQIVYQVTSNGINFTNSPYIPATVPNSEASNYANLYSEVLGLVAKPQVAYTRAGANLALQPIGSVAFDESIIPTYNVYFSDSWHMKRSFTLTYGLSYTLEMPPFEINGKQVELVGPDGNLVNTEDYLANRKRAALAGQTYNPTLGFATMPNIGKGLKYPYYPFYGGFSPRVAVAWSPGFDSGLLGKFLGHNRTVIRGGYGRIYGRLNGVNLVLVPLLGPGLLQAVSCQGASKTGQCLGTGGVDPNTAFRIGTDGMTAPLPAASATLRQPFFPGVIDPPTGVRNIPADDATVLDPHYRPERTDNFTLTIQRQLSPKLTFEVGYIGRIIKNEFQEINLDAVPHMTTLSGQTFAQAYAAVFTALCGLSGPRCADNPPASVPVQPFFEAALGGPASAYCSGSASCTAALIKNNATLIKNTAVSRLWASMNKASSWKLGRTMISSPFGVDLPGQGSAINTTTSLGYGNYNALFATFAARNWHGLTAISNFTWGRSLGTGTLGQYNSSNTALDVWNMQANYGPQNFDIKFLYNIAMYYQPPYFKGQHGLLGHLLGGWTISPLFTAQSGGGIAPGFNTGAGGCVGCESFGEVTPPASSGSTTDNAVFTHPYTGGNSAHYNVKGSNGVGTSNPFGLNMFADPEAVLNGLRPCVLGVDTSCGGYYNLRGLPDFNLDATVAKDIAVFRERVGLTLIFQFTNVLNHFQPSNPTTANTNLRLSTRSQFGRITTQANTPRNMEFGLRLHF